MAEPLRPSLIFFPAQTKATGQIPFLFNRKLYNRLENEAQYGGKIGGVFQQAAKD
jgi:hypothetical protein